jgi:glycerol-3-phosphate acyltransferase PlsY
LAIYAVTLILAYAIGTVPTGLLIGKLFGTADIRAHGSQSSGATNVLRLKGWPAGLLVALLDLSKGWVAVALIPRIGSAEPWSEAPWLPFAAGAAAVVGHIWPVTAGFRGGKGVATTAGAVLAIEPVAFAAGFSVFGLVAALTRRVSVGSLAAALALPFLLYKLGEGSQELRVVYGLVSFALIVFTHRVNIGKLKSGTEPTIGN